MSSLLFVPYLVAVSTRKLHKMSLHLSLFFGRVSLAWSPVNFSANFSWPCFWEEVGRAPGAAGWVRLPYLRDAFSAVSLGDV